jgi:hypothetical protein
MVLHNPEVAYKWFSFQQSEQPSGQPHERGNTLYSRPKNNNAMIIFWRVSPYVSEVEVKRKQSTSFIPANLSHVRIYATGHALLCDRRRIVSMLYKQVPDFEGQMLVDLTTH